MVSGYTRDLWSLFSSLQQCPRASGESLGQTKPAGALTTGNVCPWPLSACTGKVFIPFLSPSPHRACTTKSCSWESLHSPRHSLKRTQFSIPPQHLKHPRALPLLSPIPFQTDKYIFPLSCAALTPFCVQMLPFSSPWTASIAALQAGRMMAEQRSRHCMDLCGDRMLPSVLYSFSNNSYPFSQLFDSCQAPSWHFIEFPKILTQRSHSWFITVSSELRLHMKIRIAMYITSHLSGVNLICLFIIQPLNTPRLFCSSSHCSFLTGDHQHTDIPFFQCTRSSRTTQVCSQLPCTMRADSHFLLFIVTFCPCNHLYCYSPVFLNTL